MAWGRPVEIHRILGWTTQLHRSSKARPGVARWLHLDDARQHLSHRWGSCAGPGRCLCAQFAANAGLRSGGQLTKRQRSDNIRSGHKLAISQRAKAQSGVPVLCRPRARQKTNNTPLGNSRVSSLAGQVSVTASPLLTCATISFASIKACESRQQWQRASRPSFGH
jgi:hypothetical protein